MYTLKIKLNNNNGQLKTTDNNITITTDEISIDYENINYINYSIGEFAKKSTLTLVYSEYDHNITLNMEINDDYNNIINTINFIEENIARIQQPKNVNIHDKNIKQRDHCLYSIPVIKSFIKGKLEVYSDYLKIIYNDTFNIIYYNQMLNAKKDGKYFVFTLRIDNDEFYEDYWLINEFYNAKKEDTLLEYINDKISQSIKNNDIQEVKLTSSSDSNNKIFFVGTVHEDVSNLTGRTTPVYDCTAYLEEDALIIKKSSLLNMKQNNKKVPYVHISSIEYDKDATFGAINGLDIILSGLEIVTLRNDSDKITQNFYKALTIAINDYKAQHTTILQQEVISYADEFLKYCELYELGVISEEEFNLKKEEFFNVE